VLLKLGRVRLRFVWLATALGGLGFRFRRIKWQRAFWRWKPMPYVTPPLPRSIPSTLLVPENLAVDAHFHKLEASTGFGDHIHLWFDRK